MADITIFDTKIPEASEAVELFLAIGWGQSSDYSTTKWQKIFVNSQCITAYDGERLVGLLRYLTDGFQDTQICECVVSPEYQKQGIGTQMLERLIGLCGHTSIYGSALQDTESFFNRSGLQSREKMVTVSRKAA